MMMILIIDSPDKEEANFSTTSTEIHRQHEPSTTNLAPRTAPTTTRAISRLAKGVKSSTSRDLALLLDFNGDARRGTPQEAMLH
jgi:hypothetical protein